MQRALVVEKEMTKFCTFASGSKGNAALLSVGNTHILIDMGISCRRICQSLANLGLTPESLSAVLITHAHRDHIAGLATYSKKYHTPVITTAATAQELANGIAGIRRQLRCVEWGEVCQIGAVAVRVLESSHDCAGSCAFHINTPHGTVGYLTDTGYIPPKTAKALVGTKLLLLESNHDVRMVCASPYPDFLKERVLGEQGHLSNEVAAAFAVDSAKAGTQTIVLAHLSRENNAPGLALHTVGRSLKTIGYAGRLLVAPADEMSEVFQLG